MTDSPTASQALQALRRSGTGRTQIARLRELLPDIEAAQASGVKHQHILEELNAHGFALSLKAYSVMLYRLRQARAKSAGANLGAPPPAAQGLVSGTVNTPGTGPGATSTNPAPATRKPSDPQRLDWQSMKNSPAEW